MANRGILGSLPIVARMLGDKMDVTVTIEGRQAYTNGKVVNIPVLPDKPEAILMARGYVDHEAGGHVKHTEFRIMNEAHQKNVGGLTNAIEDPRIEKKAGEDYPGSKRNLKALCEFIVQEGGFTTEPDMPTIGLVSMYANQKLRVSMLGHDVCADNVAKTALHLKKRLGDRFLQDIDEALNMPLESTRDSLAMALEIKSLIKDAVEEAKSDEPTENVDQGSSDQNESQDGPGDEDGSGQNDNSEPGQGDSSDEGDKNGDSGSSGSGNDDGVASENDKNSGSTGDSQDGPGDSEGADGLNENFSGSSADAEEDQTGNSQNSGHRLILDRETGDEDCDFNGLGELLKNKLEAMSENEIRRRRRDPNDVLLDEGFSMAKEVPFVGNIETTYFRLLRENISKINRESAKSRRVLECVLEAKRRDRERVSQAGRKIRRRSLVRLATGNTRIFARASERAAVNTAVYMLIDASGSMGGISARVCAETAYCLGLSLNRVPHVSLQISSFPHLSKTIGYYAILPHTQFDKPFKLTDLKTYNADGDDTPTAPAMRMAGYSLALRPEQRKIMIVVTDGQPNAGGRNADVRKLDEWLNQNGVEVFGIGIHSDHVLLCHKNAVVIKEIEDLPATLFGLLKKKC